MPCVSLFEQLSSPSNPLCFRRYEIIIIVQHLKDYLSLIMLETKEEGCSLAKNIHDVTILLPNEHSVKEATGKSEIKKKRRLLRKPSSSLNIDANCNFDGSVKESEVSPIVGATSVTTEAEKRMKKKSKSSDIDDAKVIILEVCQAAVEVDKDSENADESKNQLEIITTDGGSSSSSSSSSSEENALSEDRHQILDDKLKDPESLIAVLKPEIAQICISKSAARMRKYRIDHRHDAVWLSKESERKKRTRESRKVKAAEDLNNVRGKDNTVDGDIIVGGESIAATRGNDITGEKKNVVGGGVEVTNELGVIVKRKNQKPWQTPAEFNKSESERARKYRILKRLDPSWKKKDAERMRVWRAKRKLLKSENKIEEQSKEVIVTDNAVYLSSASAQVETV
jgi:hypothetical protein